MRPGIFAPEGLSVIVRALVHPCSGVQKLDICKNYFGQTGDPPEPVDSLCHLLRMNHSLTDLGLGYSSLTVKHLDALHEAYLANASRKPSLHLYEPERSEEWTAHPLHALSRPKS